MKNIFRNQKVFDSLATIQTTGYKYCYLITEDNESATETAKNQQNKKKLQTGNTFLEFMYNPEVIGESYTVNYTETQIPYSELSPVNFISGGNSVWTIDNLILDGFDSKKSIQPLLDTLKELRKPSILNKVKNSPKRVYLKWGGFRFGLCVLTNVNITIERWVDGYPATARVSISLKEVPKDIDNKNTEIIKRLEKAQKDNTKIPLVLTDKQVTDATKRVQEYLQAKKTFLPTRVQQVLESRKYIIKVNKESGQVDLLDAGNQLIQTLGIYNGDKFTAR